MNRHQIVGIAGVQGNGQSELVDALIGLRKLTSGDIVFYNSLGSAITLNDKTTLERLKSGIGYIPEDRSTQGLVLDFKLYENVWLGFHGYNHDEQQQLSEEFNIDLTDDTKEDSIIEELKSILLLPFKLMRGLTKSIIETFNVKTSSEGVVTSTLSGGNQQKIVLGREFAKNPNLIIASEPTRGVDIGVMQKVHTELIERRNEGAAILLVSSDLDEVLSLSDYLVIMYEGEIVGEGLTKDLDLLKISTLMTGGRNKEVSAK